jgi:hypothetical protein
VDSACWLLFVHARMPEQSPLNMVQHMFVCNPGHLRTKKLVGRLRLGHAVTPLLRYVHMRLLQRPAYVQHSTHLFGSGVDSC